MKDAERFTEHTKSIPPLIVGDYVRIQNQTGNNPRKWDNTGKVVEVRQHDQCDPRGRFRPQHIAQPQVSAEIHTCNDSRGS